MVDATPFNDHANVKLSLLASVPLAVRLMLPLTPTIAPVAAGTIEAHTGGVFLFTVQVCVAELEPLLAVATRVFVPVLKSEEANVLLLAAAPEIGLPFKLHVTAQLASLGVTVNTLAVASAAAIRVVADDGTPVTIEHEGRTFTVH